MNRHPLQQVWAMVMTLLALSLWVCASMAAPATDNDVLPESYHDTQEVTIEAVQQVLIEYGYLAGSPSGIYDDKVTTAAIRDFQINHGLEETGVCNEETWAIMHHGSILPQRMVYRAKKGEVYHEKDDCFRMKTAIELTYSDALRLGLRPCKNCH